jgi:ABC-type dipeptide/oligopeptide/nickel transport system permease subunit
VVRSDPRFWMAVVILAALLVMALRPSAFTGQDPLSCSLSRSLDPPTAAHPFGFDLQGCDYYARTVYGAQTSLFIGVGVVAAAAVVAIVLGALAGYFGGTVDALISGATDVWLSVPLILGGMFFLSFLRTRGVLQVTLVLSMLAWPAMVRLLRASVLETKQAEYVMAARALGAGHLRLLARHIVPNSLRPLTVYAALFTATTIAAEAVLSFMGVGLQLPTISWGLMLAGIRGRLPGNPHLLIPGAFLTAAVFGFVLLSDALREALEPDR